MSTSFLINEALSHKETSPIGENRGVVALTPCI
jgi:hypothetical protein